MSNFKKLKLRKITIAKIDNSYTIKGGTGGSGEDSDHCVTAAACETITCPTQTPDCITVEVPNCTEVTNTITNSDGFSEDCNI